MLLTMILAAGSDILMQIAQIVPRGSRVQVFQRIFWVFLVLGSIVGIVVISYMLYTAYTYRAGRDASMDDDRDQPELGELPKSTGGGRKLFLSFSLSALIVVSLIIWTYGTLLYVENKPVQDQQPAMRITVTGFRFGWRFTYPNGVTTTGTLRVPADKTIRLIVTSEDVFHTFGIPELRVKTDAIPGQKTDTWFLATETGTYQAHCYELCGAGHSYMDARVIVMEPTGFHHWYRNTTAT